MSKCWGPSYKVISLGYKTPCWIWQRYVTQAGYGQINSNNRVVYAHRLYYEKYKGLIPEGLSIHHLCFNKDCVNPEHMEAITLLENQRIGDKNGKRGGRLRHILKPVRLVDK